MRGIFGPDHSLFLEILRNLEDNGSRYAIIGGFAATIYGITRATYDIDIIVELSAEQLTSLNRTYSPPRYYADPSPMSQAIANGVSITIIDTDRGEKADLYPTTMHERYEPILDDRVRQRVDLPGQEPFEVWVARPEDVILTKLIAWIETHSYRHESDIHEMMTMHYVGASPYLDPPFDEAHIDSEVELFGKEAAGRWRELKEAAHRAASGESLYG